MNQDPDQRPGENPAAALERMALWMKLHPEVTNVASQIGSSEGFRSDGWPHRLYAMDRKDVLAVLELARSALKGRGEAE